MSNKKVNKRIHSIIVIFIILLVAIWFNNTSIFVPNHNKQPELLAHRGLGQSFDLKGVKWNTNTAAIIHEPEHPYLENTIDGIAASIKYGADIVEFDIHLTKDKQLAVFHDYILEHRTNGKGPLSDYTINDLKKLDIGYGYTADGGKTYPFRGKGIGKMPDVEQVLKSFPKIGWLIHIRDGGIESARILESHLIRLNGNWLQRVALYGDEAAINYFRYKYPTTIKTLSKSTIIKAFIQYELIGWTGYIPKAMHNLEIHIPVNYAWLFWGWPYKFIKRMDSVNTRVCLVKYVNGWSDGFDTKSDLEKLPQNYTGCIWTNRIDIIGPIIKNRDFRLEDKL
jgi:glycerophosphoryl diester phosphodiesterase